MTFHEANWFYIAQNYLKKFGLWEQGWRVRLDNRKNALGGCNRHRQTITLSKFYIKWLTFKQMHEEIRDTVLHEIAHALAWINSGCWDHGPIWRMWARRVGAKPRTTCAFDLPPQAYRWWLRDSRTGEFIRGWHRQPRNYPPSRVKRMWKIGDSSSLGHLEIVQVSA